MNRVDMFGAAALTDRRWWAVPASQYEAYKAKQIVLERDFGDDFKNAMIEAYGIGVSPDGYVLGFEFELATGAIIRAALPVACVDDWCLRYMRALESAKLRRGETFDE